MVRVELLVLFVVLGREEFFFLENGVVGFLSYGQVCVQGDDCRGGGERTEGRLCSGLRQVFVCLVFSFCKVNQFGVVYLFCFGLEMRNDINWYILGFFIG